MSLTDEKITKNARKYFQTGEEYGFIPESLMTFLGADIIAAPAFPTNNMPNAFNGGLIDFMLGVTKNLISLNETFFVETERIDKTSLVKVGILFLIGKSKLYKPNTNEWRVKNLGEIYSYDETLTSMRVGQRSLYYAMSHGITFTEDEAQAIVFHDVDDDKMVKGYSSKLTRLLKIAIELTMLQKK